MALIRNMAVCEATDFLHFARQEGLAQWNELHDLIWDHDNQKDHRHWFLNSFIITTNFFNPDYQDDAYGLLWNERVRDIVQKYMKKHRLKNLMVVTCKNHSLSIL